MSLSRQSNRVPSWFVGPPASLASAIVLALAVAALASGSYASITTGGNQSFSSVLTEFASAWDAQDLGRLTQFIDPDVGLWVIHSHGVLTVLSHYPDLKSALDQGPFEVGLGKLVHFNSCKTSPGPVPTCEPDGIREAQCHYGSSSPSYLGTFDHLLEGGVLESEAMPTLRTERSNLAAASGSTVHYVSDSSWGAVFYFSRSSGSWRLLVIDVFDCSV